MLLLSDELKVISITIENLVFVISFEVNEEFDEELSEYHQRNTSIGEDSKDHCISAFADGEYDFDLAEKRTAKDAHSDQWISARA